MKTRIAAITAIAALALIVADVDARGRGGGGRGGGRGFSGGGGRGFSGGGGYSRGASARPSRPQVSRPSRPSSPSLSRPSVSRPSVSRPQPGSRPQIGNRPNTLPGNRPSAGGGNLSLGSRPSIKPANRPSTLPGNTLGNRPNIGGGDRPNIGSGNRPNIGGGDRPNLGGGNRPNIGSGNRPSQLPSLPGAGNRPGANRPGLDGRPATLPGLGARPGTLPAAGRRPGMGPGHTRPYYRPAHLPANRYHRWHHGHWHGHYWHPLPRLNYWWNRYPVLTTMGLSTWAINRVGWAAGYYDYSNPYCEPSSTTVYDYTEPLPVEEAPVDAQAADGAAPAAASDVLPPGVSEAALNRFDTARQQFYSGKYTGALASVDAAIKEMPSDAVLHEFRALTLFALGKYQDAAATLYAVLSAGPGWDWTTMSGLYPNVETYTKQLRAAEQYRDEHPDDPAIRLVLAYHYLTTGQSDPAKTQLERLVELTPNDPLAKQLLQELDPDAVPKDSVERNVPPLVEGTTEENQFVGSWKATREGGDAFALQLNADGTFQWQFTPAKDGEPQTLKGKYTLDDKGVLMMNIDSGGVLPAQLVPQDKGFQFYMLGDSQGAAPLDFTKA